MRTKLSRQWAWAILTVLPWLVMCDGRSASWADEGIPSTSDASTSTALALPSSLDASASATASTMPGIASDTGASLTTELASPPAPSFPTAVELFGANLEKIDEMNDGLMYSWHLANVKAEEVIETLKAMFAKPLKEERIIIVENKARNSIMAGFPDKKEPGLRKDWGQMMASLDRPTEQALIEVMIVELVLNDLGQWGADLQALANSVVGGNEFVQTLGIAHTAGSMDAVAKGVDGVKYYVTSGDKLKALMFAGQTLDRTRVLSSPQIIASNHKPAVFKLGQTLPIQTGSTIANGVTTYSYTEKDIGININLTPHFDMNGRVNLDINQEVNTLLSYDPDKRVAQFAHKTLTSNVTLQSGQTVILGGYIQDSNLLNRKQIPGLTKIPFFGKFLNRDTNTDQKIEVIVFITPKVLTNNKSIDVKEIAKKNLFEGKDKVIAKLDTNFDLTPIGTRRTQRIEKKEAQAQARKAAANAQPVKKPAAAAMASPQPVSAAARATLPKPTSVTAPAPEGPTAKANLPATAAKVNRSATVAQSKLPDLVAKLHARLESDAPKPAPTTEAVPKAAPQPVQKK